MGNDVIEYGKVNEVIVSYMPYLWSEDTPQKIADVYGEEVTRAVKVVYDEAMDYPMDWSKETVGSAPDLLTDFLTRQYSWLSQEAKLRLTRCYVATLLRQDWKLDSRRQARQNFGNYAEFMPMTRENILKQLDDAAQILVLPMLDDIDIYLGDVRMSIYRDEIHWLMIIEVLGIDKRMTGRDSFVNQLYIFGNALTWIPGTDDDDRLYPVESLPEDPLFEDEVNDWYVRPEVRALAIRGHKVSLDLSEAVLEKKDLTLLDPPKIDPVVVLRSLLPEYRDLLLASSEELDAYNIYALPLWLQLTEWYHPDLDLAYGELPSQTESFSMPADAIVSGDRQQYAPTTPPNTHWKNWPGDDKS